MDWEDVPGASFTFTLTSTARIFAQGHITLTNNEAGAGSDAEIRLVVAGEESGPTQMEPFADLERSTLNMHRTAAAYPPGNYTVKLQWRRVNGTATVQGEDVQLFAISLRGRRGEKGVPGSGSTISLEQAGIPVAGGPFDTVNFEGAAVTDEGGGTAKIENVFGSQNQDAEDETTSSTTSSTYQNKLNLTTGVLPAGRYRIGWYCEGAQSTTSDRFQMRVQIDDSDTLGQTMEETADTDDWMPHGGYAYRNLSGSISIDMDWREQAGGTASIRRARLEIWRVS